MPWTQTDTSFKKLQNKRITTSTGKGIDEEKGASALELYLPDIKTDLIPGTPPGASTTVLAYTGAIGQTLAVDTSVPSNLTWFATSGYGNTTNANDGSALSESQRLGDWISDKYDAFGTVSGAGYEIKVYDKDSNLITKADPSDWLFDYQTGILVFNNANTAYGAVTSSGPFRIVGYRYIGNKGVISPSYGGIGYTTYTKGDLLVGSGNTLYRLPVGTDNYVLTADSSTGFGITWKTAAATGLTTLNSLTSTFQYFETGSSGNFFNISSSGQTHTFNIPIAGTGSTGLVTNTAQSFGGIKTFSQVLVASSGATVSGTLALPDNPLAGLYGGTGYSNYTKGDLIVGAGSTFIKLAVGSNGYVLSADSTNPAGLGWTTVSGVAISTSPPSSPKNADLWFNSTDGSLSAYYQDVDTSQWVEIAIGSGIDLSQPVHITNTTASSSTVSGALQVDGGVGIQGQANAQSLGVNNIYDYVGVAFTTSTTTIDQVAHSLSASTYRTLKYTIQVTSSTDYNAIEILMMHDGSTVYMTEYAQLLAGSGSTLSTYNADINSGNIRLLVSPTNSSTTYKLQCTAMKV